jgi:hypothetical protein
VFIFEEEPGRRSAAKLLETGRGAADRCEYRQAARVFAQVLNAMRKVLVDTSGGEGWM